MSQKLYPTGRAFRMKEEGTFYKLHQALNSVLAGTYADANQILNDILPDNADFDINDAHDWYRRLGLYDSGTVSLTDMKKAIAQKLSFPQVPLNKQHWQYIQDQLQAAGFNVYIYANRWPDGLGGYTTRTPGQVLGTVGMQAMYGYSQYGTFQYGQADTSKISIIANYLEEEKDAVFDFGSNLRHTFFVADASPGVFASVPAARKIEFRQLLMKLKRAEMAGFLFVNYV